jgi:hypothetical protein
MHESDLVVRRRLAQKMALRIQETARSEEPSEPELDAFLEAHPERWTEPARVELVQLYFRDAGRARAGLAALGNQPDAPEVRGDVLPLPSRLPAQSRAELTNLLGPDFARQAFELPQGRWSGPIRSTYGSHLVYVLDRRPATRSPLAAVRSEVREGLLAERGRDALLAELAALRWRRSAGGGGETAP